MSLQPPTFASNSEDVAETQSVFSSASTLRPSSTSISTSESNAFLFPPVYFFPPFFTSQVAQSTRQAQLTKWSALIQSYCAHHRIFRLALTAATLSSPLFHNATLGRRLAERDARDVLDWMAGEAGGRRVEWISASAGSRDRDRDRDRVTECWVWWRQPEEWAGLLERWVVEETGQRGQVLTLYELLEGEETKGEAFHGMDGEVLQRALGVLVKRGKAQVFGTEGQEGVKFF